MELSNSKPAAIAIAGLYQILMAMASFDSLDLMASLSKCRLNR